MSRKVIGILSLVIIMICMAYIVFDIATGRSEQNIISVVDNTNIDPVESDWIIDKELKIRFGKPIAICVTDNDQVFIAGKSFLAAYKMDLSQLWNIKLEEPIYALSVYGDTIYAATEEEIWLYDLLGNLMEKWGPYDDEAILTSVTANKKFVAFADAGNQLVYVLNKSGALQSIVGYHDNKFIVPSAYFDVYLTKQDTLVIVNPGKRNIEFRNIKGHMVRAIGEDGDEWENFCGCCNPSHFSYAPNGNIVTSEKGINRIKIIKPTGELIELVAQPVNFAASVPVDLSVSKQGLIFAANSNDSKIYRFKRLNHDGP